MFTNDPSDILNDQNTNQRKMEQNEIIEYIPYQKCPKCDGQGTVSKPPYIAGDVFQWNDTSAIHQCNVCQGKMIIPMFPINTTQPPTP